MKITKKIFLLFCTVIACNSCATISKPLSRDCAKHSGGTIECKFETKGTISFEHKDGKTLANINPIGEFQMSSMHWPKTAAPCRDIDTAKVYRLQYFKTKTGRGASDWADTTLYRIIDGDHILYDASLCQLHNEVMERQTEEEVSYDGYYSYRKDYFSGGKPRLCPNDGKAYLTCDAGIEHMTWRCPSCYKYSENWKLKHGIN